MKRVLALVLTVVMLVSCMVFTALPTSAAAAVHSVTLSSCDYSLEGLNGFSVPHDDLAIEGEEGNYVVRRLKAGSYSGAGSLVNFNFVAPEPIDLTGADYLVLEYYCADAAAFNGKSFQVELNAATRNDANGEWERALAFSDLVDGTWQNGWNTVKIPLSGAPFDITKWQWFRVFNTNAVEVNLAADTLIGLRGMYLLKGEEKVTVNECKATRKGWGGAMQTRFYTANEEIEGDYDRTYVGRTLTGNVAGNGAVMYFNRKNAYPLEADAEYRTIDASFAKYLVFDLYVSDAAAIKDVDGFFVEVNSAGAADQQERQWTKSLNAFADYKLKDGWNHIMIGLDNEQFTKQGAEDIDWTNVCWIRITNNNAFDLGEKSVDIGLDNIYFWDGYTSVQDGFDYEVIEATGWKDDPYLIETDGAGKHDADFTFSDKTGHATLKFDIAHAATADKVYLETKTGSQLKLEVSMDNENWKEVFEVTENVVVQTRYWDITDLVDFNKSGTIYVKYTDSVPEDGNGGRMYNCKLSVSYEVIDESAVDPHYTVVHACDSSTGIGGFAFDNEIAGATGKGCVSQTFTGNITNTAGFIFQLKLAQTRVPSYDTTNFYAVVFDLYVSNAAALKDTPFDIEFTSSGTCDDQENATNAKLSSFVAEGTTWKDGWNTIVVPFEKLTGVSGGGLNRAAWNYVRIFNQGGGFDAGEGLTVAFDNIRLWDGSDGTITSEVTPEKVTDTIYKFTFNDYLGVKDLYIEGDAGDKIQVSFDGKEYADVAKADGKYSLNAIIDTLEPNFVVTYVKTAAAAELKAKITHKEIVSAEDKDMYEMTSTSHSKLLVACESNWSFGEIIRSNPNPAAGTTSLKITPTSASSHTTPNIKFDDVDCTGMDTFEFQIYFSDQAFMDFFAQMPEGQIELCSGGTCDNEETMWDITNLVKAIDGEAKPGEWLTVRLPLSTGNQGELQVDHVNYIRIYFHPHDVEFPGDGESFFCVDNFRMTDYEQTAIVDAAPYVDAANEKVAALRAAIGVESGNKVPDGAITEANYEAVKAAYTAAKEAQDAIPPIASGEFKDGSFMRNVKTAIAKYETPAETSGEPDSETKGQDNESETKGQDNESETGSTTPGSDDKETKAQEEKKGGCGSVVVGGAIVVLAVVSVAGAMIVRKKKD